MSLYHSLFKHVYSKYLELLPGSSSSENTIYERSSDTIFYCSIRSGPGYKKLVFDEYEMIGFVDELNIRVLYGVLREPTTRPVSHGTANLDIHVSFGSIIEVMNLLSIPSSVLSKPSCPWMSE